MTMNVYLAKLSGRRLSQRGYTNYETPVRRYIPNLSQWCNSVLAECKETERRLKDYRRK